MIHSVSLLSSNNSGHYLQTKTTPTEFPWAFLVQHTYRWRLAVRWNLTDLLFQRVWNFFLGQISSNTDSGSERPDPAVTVLTQSKVILDPVS